MNILTIGAILCDVSMKDIDGSDFENGRSVLSAFDVQGGGDANNAAIDLAILGENVRVSGRVGRDFLGDRVLSLLNEKGVDTSFVKRAEEPTTVSVLMLGKSGEVTLNVLRTGANESLAIGDVTPEMIAWADHVHMVNVLNMHDFDGEGTARVFRMAHEAGKTTSMDLKRRINESLDDPMALLTGALENCDLFLPSNYEVDYLIGEKTPEEAAEYFRTFGVKVFVEKLGAKGVFVTDYQDAFYQPSLYTGTPVDVIGAGDAFSATFTAAWKRGYDVKTAAKIASAASAGVVGKIGATAGMRDFEELCAAAEVK